MSQAPLPPHERTWRHPSELAAAERDAVRTAAAPSTTRLFALATGSFGLLAVGLLVMSVAPDRRESPVAVSATTSPGAVVRAGGVAAIGRFASDTSGSDMSPMRIQPALATPIGDGRSALTTLQAARRTEGAIDVRLSSGSVVSAAVLDATDDGLVVVTIATTDQAHVVGDEPPDPDEIVTVLTEPPITVPFHAVDDLELAEGTPVLDDEGALVGLCTRTDGRASVLDVTGHDDAADDTGGDDPAHEGTGQDVAPAGPGRDGAPTDDERDHTRPSDDTGVDDRDPAGRPGASSPDPSAAPVTSGDVVATSAAGTTP